MTDRISDVRQLIEEEYQVIASRPMKSADEMNWEMLSGKCGLCKHRLADHFPRSNLVCCRECEKVNMQTGEAGGLCDINPTNHPARVQYEGYIVNCGRKHAWAIKGTMGKLVIFRCKRMVGDYRCTRVHNHKPVEITTEIVRK